MRHYNIRENCVRESILEQETKVNHIAGPKNPGDLMTKDHKSDEIYRELRDVVVFKTFSFLFIPTSSSLVWGCQISIPAFLAFCDQNVT